MSATRLVLVGGALLCVLGLGGGSLAQTQQPKAAPQTQSQPAPASAAPQPNWILACANAQQGLNCQVGGSLALDETGRAKLNVAVRVPAATKKPIMLLQLPLGLYLPAGVSLQFGQNTAKVLPFQTCGPAGCLVEYPISDAEIGAMLNGADLMVSVQNAEKQPLKIQVSVTGFAGAYAKIK